MSTRSEALREGESDSRRIVGRGRIGFPVVLACVFFACASSQGGWDRAGLEKRYPAVSAIRWQRLSDTPPYFVPDDVGIRLFLCRWQDEVEIPVVLPADANESEQTGLRQAMAAWERAGLGVRFREVAALEGGRGIEIRLFGASDEAIADTRTADTIADCRVETHARDRADDSPVDARLEFASIFMRRANLDSLGRSLPLTRSQLAGQALHEFGHALGFSGHVANLRSIMTPTHEVANRWGEAAIAGKPFSDPSVKALYKVPSGVVVGTLDPPTERLTSLRRFMSLANESTEWVGPYVRVGQRDARIFWKRASGQSAIFELRKWVEMVDDHEPFVLRLSTAAQQAVSGS